MLRPKGICARLKILMFFDRPSPYMVSFERRNTGGGSYRTYRTYRI